MSGKGTEGNTESLLGKASEGVELVSDQLYHKSYQYFRICN